MRSVSIKKSFLRSVLFLFTFASLSIVSCHGVHNDPPAEVIRRSGAGPSTGSSAGTTALVSGEQTTEATPVETEASTLAEETLSTVILDSTGNPIDSKKKK